MSLSSWWQGFVVGGALVGWLVACIAMAIYFLRVPPLRAKLATIKEQIAPLFVVMLALGALGFAGCATARGTGRSMTAAFGNMVTVQTDLPVRSTAVSVLNKTPDTILIYVDRVGMGGDPIAEVPPYGHVVVPFGNWSRNSVEVRLIAHLVRAGRVAGVASESFSVSGYYANSPELEIEPDDFR